MLRRLFGGGDGGGTHDVRELARRLGLLPEDLSQVEPSYDVFEIPKRTGGMRLILAPKESFKEFQRRLLRRVLARLPAHPAAHGFERGRSIATHARKHVGGAVVVKLDVRDFFPSTRTKRVKEYFRAIGWDAKAAGLLTSWCTHKGGLPQGAPTSPRLSNLVNRHLDARISGLAGVHGASYSRYADDMTFSWIEDRHDLVNSLVALVKNALSESGYRLHTGKKLRIMRRHDRQLVTGLVVNERVALPRRTRRWLRAVEHRMRTGGEATLTEEQLGGWRALEHMIDVQGRSGPPA